MKFIIIPYIALGFVLSLILGIEYYCEGTEMFPTYYGSPFVFKQKSLGSSMEYFYSISGLLWNILVWSFMLFVINIMIQRLIQKVNQLMIIYKIIIGFLMVFTILNIAMDSIMIGNQFGKGLNDWSWNIDKEASDWGVTCERTFVIFQQTK